MGLTVRPGWGVLEVLIEEDIFERIKNSTRGQHEPEWLAVGCQWNRYIVAKGVPTARIARVEADFVSIYED